MKPSIFSKDYNRYIKRKRRIKLVILIIVSVLICSFFIFRFGIKAYFDKILSTPVKPIAKQQAEQNKTLPQQKTEKTEDNFKEIILSDSLTIKAGIDATGTEVKYNGIVSDGFNGSYDISKAADQMVILDKTSQTVYLVDKDGKSTDITYKKYISKSKKVYEKTKILKEKPDYIWADSPKFLGETKILYISNVPWFGTKRRQYLWIYDIKANTYKYLVRGDSIMLNGVKDKGFEVKLDDKTIYIDNDGRIVK